MAFELREGKQHCQKDTTAFLVQCLRDAQALITQRIDSAQKPRILLRLDSGNDSTDNIDVDVSLFHGHREFADANLIERGDRHEYTVRYGI